MPETAAARWPRSPKNEGLQEVQRRMIRKRTNPGCGAQETVWSERRKKFRVGPQLDDGRLFGAGTAEAVRHAGGGAGIAFVRVRSGDAQRRCSAELQRPVAMDVGQIATDRREQQHRADPSPSNSPRRHDYVTVSFPVGGAVIERHYQQPPKIVIVSHASQSDSPNSHPTAAATSSPT